MIERKSASDLKQILETIPQITLTASSTGSMTYFNKFFLEYAGMTIGDALEKGWDPIIKPEMLNDVKRKWNHSINTGKDFIMEFPLLRKHDRMYRWHLVRATAIKGYDGEVNSWVGSAIDFHDQKMKDMVKDEFISIASHELKTPLTTAKAYIQLLEQNLGELDEANRQYAKKASSSINRLNDLVSELLDASKIQHGRLNLNITVFDFTEMVLTAIEAVQFMSPGHTILMSGEIGQPVSGDKERLKQVIVNLLTNAVKYSPGSDKVFVNLNDKDGQIKVSVKDMGIGIRKENIEKIFLLYYREEGRPNNFSGLGIGLAIAHEIIQLHKGKIWAESESGKGSIFHFTIPA